MGTWIATKAMLLIMVSCLQESLAKSNSLAYFQNKDCKLECSSGYEPVCGTNGRTYSNTCRLDLRNCRREDSPKVTVAYYGECAGRMPAGNRVR
ncbi:hepatopancreas kazal-type proteinase inhibitor [Biomphalaria pfeifferi]|uniref:Hepatopancreas kazal-type proteinase inhibitor n=1 Tax=Biomphalaria pfeifferi TaxID=112525 RepID=A0AAD8BWB6_BIOPF|nr:hepatopancreas kazal-type proteinase inhibitor [Biomphalaria pfeifferi]